MISVLIIALISVASMAAVNMTARHYRYQPTAEQRLYQREAAEALRRIEANRRTP